MSFTRCTAHSPCIHRPNFHYVIHVNFPLLDQTYPKSLCFLANICAPTIAIVATSLHGKNTYYLFRIKLHCGYCNSMQLYYRCIYFVKNWYFEAKKKKQMTNPVQRPERMNDDIRYFCLLEIFFSFGPKFNKKLFEILFIDTSMSKARYISSLWMCLGMHFISIKTVRLNKCGRAIESGDWEYQKLHEHTGRPVFS